MTQNSTHLRLEVIREHADYLFTQLFAKTKDIDSTTQQNMGFPRLLIPYFATLFTYAVLFRAGMYYAVLHLSWRQPGAGGPITPTQ